MTRQIHKDEPISFVGLDLSVNHFGVAIIDPTDSDRRFSAAYMTDKRKYFSSPKGVEVVGTIPYTSCFLSTHNRYQRMREVARHAMHCFYHLQDPEKCAIVNIEHYAFGAQGRSAYQIGEIGGIVRERLYRFSGLSQETFPVFIRETDPKTVKLWAGNGDFTKEQCLQFAQDYVVTPQRIAPQLIHKRPDASDIMPDCPASDIADAFILAHMAMVEWNVRMGKTLLSDLPTHQIEIFNRVTKAFPENLLVRPYIQNEGDNED